MGRTVTTVAEGAAILGMFSVAQAAYSAAKGAIASLTLVQAAEIETTMKKLLDEIEKTKRRVNALEYVLIPSLEQSIKYITMKLDENERGNLTRLMKVKDMMIEQARQAMNE